MWLTGFSGQLNVTQASLYRGWWLALGVETGPPAAADAIEAYWTPEHMRDARPAEYLPELKAALAKHDRDAAAAQQPARSQRPKPGRHCLHSGRGRSSVDRNRRADSTIG